MPGCVEHYQKLLTTVQDAHERHRPLAVCWLDLGNAYGSVHHNLIAFSLQHYHTPLCFQDMVRNIYSDLRAVTSKDWCSAPIPLLIGVYQGDPLFPVVFDTVMSTLTDSLRSHNSCGYTMSGSSLSTNVLLYADDVCLLADGPAGAQLLLSQVERWLEWSGMRAKIVKCSALAIAASSARRFDPTLSLNGQAIHFAGSSPVRFLGGPISIPTNSRGQQRRVLEKLELLLTRVDKCLVTRKQKLLLYKAGVCPRMNWELVTGDFPIS